MIDWIKRLFHAGGTLPTAIARPHKFVRQQMTEREWFVECYKNDRCPSCGHSIEEYWREGPSGGLSTNMACSFCLARWNLTIIAFGNVEGDPTIILERTGDVKREDIG